MTMQSNLAPLPQLPALTVQLLTVSVILLQRTARHNNIKTTRSISSHYDFVVVGAGSAGSVVAARLTENPDTTVLVLEAGGPQTATTDMPGFQNYQYNTDVDWTYRSTSQIPYASLVTNGIFNIPKGRVVGGSHNLNILGYSRGNRKDFDRWANNLGATGWSYNDVLPYFLRSENNVDQSIVYSNPGYHSTSGPMVVLTPKNPDPVITQIKNVILERGYPHTDQNGQTQLGVNYFQQTIYENATRSTTASAFLEANMGRPNLQVLTNAFVTRILFNQNANGTFQSSGVEYEFNGQTHSVYVNREIVLSGGSINTPQLLMLSGIGPREHLTKFGIKTLIDLPVGFNLKDHASVVFYFDVVDSNMITTGNELTLENLFRYYANGAGPLSQFPMVYWYLNSVFNNETDWPDAQIDYMVVPVGNDLESLVSSIHENNRQAWRNYYREHVGQPNTLEMTFLLFRSKSVGRLMLNSSNPHDQPLINPRYFTESRDFEIMIDVIKRGLKLVYTSSIQRLLRLWQQPIPGCPALCSDVPIWECTPYLECYARSVTHTIGHQVGTCKMGSNPLETVVDPRLRVRGVTNLRLIDSSVFPDITNGNTNAPTIMIAEYGSSMIRQDNHI